MLYRSNNILLYSLWFIATGYRYQTTFFIAFLYLFYSNHVLHISSSFKEHSHTSRHNYKSDIHHHIHLEYAIKLGKYCSKISIWQIVEIISENYKQSIKWIICFSPMLLKELFDKIVIIFHSTGVESKKIVILIWQN